MTGPDSETSSAASLEPVPGSLVLVATPIGNLGDLSSRAVETLRAADWIYAEDTRRTRGLLSHCGIEAGGRLRGLHAHNEQQGAARVVELVQRGATVAYVSDAGMPAISDPGERLVRACADAGLTVTVVPGPSAVLGALALAGLPTVPFTFVGFLARKGRARTDAVRAIATSAVTSVLFESPLRLRATLDDLAAVTGADRSAAVVRELTKLHESVVRGTLASLSAAVATGNIPARGECVIVVGGAPINTEPADPAVASARADALLAGGLGARDAARALSDELGLTRREAYDLVIARRAPSS